jgi:superfamily II DNA/RNA helicase
MAPTRELAVQIESDLRNLAKGSGLAGVLCIGGTSVRQQMVLLKDDYNFLIGTPGRIKDMSNQKCIDWTQFDAVVLDEVDRMLDMGFIRDVREILSYLPHDRQTMFFSATLPNEVERLCVSFSKSPVFVKVASNDHEYPIRQHLIKLSGDKHKIEVLYDLLSQQQEFKKVIVFGRTKHGVKRLAEELDRRGFAADSIHGNKSQAARQKALGMFKSDRISILVATDVAARGIDVADITHVINYDLPETFEDYVHRIGRTGRAGNLGQAITLIDQLGY